MSNGWALVDRIQAGDGAAMDELYRAYQPLLFRYAHKRLRNPEMAEDITSDAWIRILRGLSRVDKQQMDPGAWMFTITRNLIADYYKSARYNRDRPDGDTEAQSTTDTSSEGDPEGTVTDYLMDRTIAQAVRQVLTAEQRRVITLRFYLGLDVAETAEVMGKECGAIKSLQMRAVRALAKALGDNVSDAVLDRRAA